jgi:hypothetical protein
MDGERLKAVEVHGFGFAAFRGVDHKCAATIDPDADGSPSVHPVVTVNLLSQDEIGSNHDVP